MFLKREIKTVLWKLVTIFSKKWRRWVISFNYWLWLGALNSLFSVLLNTLQYSSFTRKFKNIQVWSFLCVCCSIWQNGATQLGLWSQSSVFDETGSPVGTRKVQVSRISVVGLTYLAKSSLSVAVSRSMHDKYVRITKPHHSAKWLQHTSTVSGVICQKADFRTFLPWSAHSAWNRLWRHYRHPV